MTQHGHEDDDDDHVVRFLKSKGIDVTRENYIDINWLGETPDPWTEEHEAELPEYLQEK